MADLGGGYLAPNNNKELKGGSQRNQDSIISHKSINSQANKNITLHRDNDKESNNNIILHKDNNREANNGQCSSDNFSRFNDRSAQLNKEGGTETDSQSNDHQDNLGDGQAGSQDGGTVNGRTSQVTREHQTIDGGYVTSTDNDSEAFNQEHTVKDRSEQGFNNGCVSNSDNKCKVQNQGNTHQSIGRGVAQRLMEIGYECIQYGKHNSDDCGLRIRLPTNWNLELMEQELEGYSDKKVITYMKYGWPVNRSIGESDPIASEINHKGATQFKHEITEYLRKEVGAGRMVGPLEEIPFQHRVGISPLSSRPKKDCAERRIIVDFSWPLGRAVNDGIDKDVYMGDPMKLRYPTLDTFTRRVAQLGRGAAVFKKDMKSAFRQLWGDPFDYSLMLYQWEGSYYVDLAVSMGMRSAPSCCQRVISAIRFIHMKSGYWLMNYIDDFIGAERWTMVWDSYYKLGQLFSKLGAVEALSKASQPDTQVVCLGTLVDTLSMTIQVMPERLVEIMHILQQWRHREFATRKQLESLIGKLQFITQCVRQGRVFISRLLNWLRTMHSRVQKYEVPYEARRDIRWWYLFLPKYNGTSILWYLNVVEVDSKLATDSCLFGCGGISEGQFYRARFPKELQECNQNNIAVLEMYAILVGLKLWSNTLAGYRFKISCDNMACVQLINNGRARDPQMQNCLRELAYVTATIGCQVRAQHIIGENNFEPDVLSRWTRGAQYKRQFRKFNQKHKYSRRWVKPELFQFTHQW